MVSLKYRQVSFSEELFLVDTCGWVFVRRPSEMGRQAGCLRFGPEAHRESWCHGPIPPINLGICCLERWGQLQRLVPNLLATPTVENRMLSHILQVCSVLTSRACHNGRLARAGWPPTFPKVWSQSRKTLKLGLTWARAMCVRGSWDLDSHRPRGAQRGELPIILHCLRHEARLLLLWKHRGEMVLRQGEISGAAGQSIQEGSRKSGRLPVMMTSERVLSF